MKLEEIKKQAIDEIESALWKLGENGEDSIFPNFEIDNCELDYGIQKDDNGDILLETKYVDKNKNERVCIKVKIEVEKV